MLTLLFMTLHYILFNFCVYRISSAAHLWKNSMSTEAITELKRIVLNAQSPHYFSSNIPLFMNINLITYSKTLHY